MSPTAKAQLQLHTCVVLWGFTAILGKLISLSALPLVWWRMLLVSGTILLVPRVWRAWRRMSPRTLLAFAGIGFIVALHWLTFYGAIKLANASVAATCIGLGPVFLALVEPALTGKRFDPRELLLGVAVVPGVALVAGGVPEGMRLGVWVGALSALLVAVFGSLNKRLLDRGEPLAITGLELGAGMLLLSVMAPFFPHEGPAFPLPSPRDGLLLLVLALGCTLLPFTLSLVALRHVSAFAAQLVVNLEPVYAILIGALLLGEHRELEPGFYLGVAIVLGAVLIHPWLRAGGKPVAAPPSQPVG